MRITREITVKLVVVIPDTDENPEESVDEILTDIDYSFEVAAHHSDECSIESTEIISYGN